VINQEKIPWNTLPCPTIEPRPQGGQTVKFIYPPTELLWLIYHLLQSPKFRLITSPMCCLLGMDAIICRCAYFRLICLISIQYWVTTRVTSSLWQHAALLVLTIPNTSMASQWKDILIWNGYLLPDRLAFLVGEAFSPSDGSWLVKHSHLLTVPGWWSILTFWPFLVGEAFSPSDGSWLVKHSHLLTVPGWWSILTFWRFLVGEAFSLSDHSWLVKHSHLPVIHKICLSLFNFFFSGTWRPI